MQFIPVKTRLLIPPQDDLLSAFRDSLPAIQNGDVVLISSKVVAIHEGRAVLIKDADKKKLIKQEADLIIERPYLSAPLTVP